MLLILLSSLKETILEAHKLPKLPPSCCCRSCFSSRSLSCRDSDGQVLTVAELAGWLMLAAAAAAACAAAEEPPPPPPDEELLLFLLLRKQRRLPLPPEPRPRPENY